MSELSQLKDAQYHLSALEKLIKENKWYDLARQVETLEGAKVKILDTSPAGEIPETDRLYDVLEQSTNGLNPPDISYTSLSRVVASSKYEELLASGVSPDDIRIKRVK